MSFNIVIVGTGIAGLGAAIALVNKGHKVTLLEATSQLRPIGGIMVLQANGNRVLDGLGVYKSLLPICTKVTHGPSTRRYDDGRFLVSLPADTHEREYGYPLWPVHRADLQRVLYEAAKSRGISIKFGCRVVAVNANRDLVAVEIEGGQRLVADLVVGADGIESNVRRSIMPGAACVRDSNMDITRATVPAAIVRSNAETADFMDHISLWCGPFASIAAMPVRRGDEWLLGLDCCHRRHSPREECKDRSQDVEQLQEIFKDFSPAMRTILSFVQEARIWRLRESIPKSWVGSFGNVVLIGDAAHGALPWVGQGGSMALEDATTLAECLARAKSTMDIPDVLDAFQQIRKPRCKQVQEWSAIKGQRATLPDGPEQRERDEKLSLSNAWVQADPWDKRHIDEVPEHESVNWKAWLSGHDAVQFANRELDKRFARKQSRDPIHMAQ